MKRIISGIFACVCVCVAFAADMTGIYNTWLGYIAGINADGERTTVQGAGAGGNASGLIRTDLIGAAAGAYSLNLTDCVGIGFRSLLYSSNMQSVVAIGTDALTNRTGLTKATWVNGQFAAFAQNNSFWVKANPATADTNAPIHYANGVLSLNADEVRINGETTGGGGSGGASAPVLAGFDLYVDPVNGDDAFEGTTPGTAKRTIDGALLAEGERIALLAGEYAVPTNVDVSETRRFYAPYGSDYTTVQGKPGDKWGFQPKYIENCTLDDLVAERNGYSSFCGHASNCVIRTRTNSKNNNGILFSTIEDCRVYCHYEDTAAQGNRGMFNGVTARDSTFDIYSTNGVSVSLSSNEGATFENCYIVATNVGFVAYSGAVTFNNCTVLIPENATWGSVGGSGSLFGCGHGDGVLSVDGTANICEPYTNIAPRIGADLRPAVSDWQYYFNGYGSEADRAFRDAVKASISAE